MGTPVSTEPTKWVCQFHKSFRSIAEIKYKAPHLLSVRLQRRTSTEIDSEDSSNRDKQFQREYL